MKNRVNAYTGWLTINAAIVLVANNTSAEAIAKVESIVFVVIIFTFICISRIAYIMIRLTPLKRVRHIRLTPILAFETFPVAFK